MNRWNMGSKKERHGSGTKDGGRVGLRTGFGSKTENKEREGRGGVDVEERAKYDKEVHNIFHRCQYLNCKSAP